MKGLKKILLFFTIIPLLLLSLILAPSNLKITNAESTTKKEKFVAVVYDNSSSMMTSNKNYYSQYAMKSLMAILDSSDNMKIFPLNGYDKFLRPNGVESLEVNLASENREAEINRVVDTGVFTPSGGTPSAALGRAVSWLTSEGIGLNKDEVISDKDFWLVILSDGEFDESQKAGSTITTSDVIREQISGYVGLQTIYFGMCVKDTMRIDALVKENSAVSAYYTNTSQEIISAMQDITNRATGRYTLTEGMTLSENVLEIDLSVCDFSVVSMSILAQGDGGAVVLNSVSCSTNGTKVINQCSVSEENVKLSGCIATILPNNADGYFSKDKLILQFSSKPKQVDVLLEPAIKLEAELQHLNSGNWESITIEDVNTSLRKGEKLRTSYKLLDRMTNKDLTYVLTDAVATVSYNGSILAYDQPFELSIGKKEVALSVAVKINGSEYVLYNSWVCDIDENPQNFRIEANTNEEVFEGGQKVKVDYTIYYDNQKIEKSDLEGLDKKFNWEISLACNTAEDEKTLESVVVNDDGTISAVYNIIEDEYGIYSCKLKVSCIENKRYRVNTAERVYYPKSLTLSTNQTDNMTLSLNQLKKNDKPFEFALTSGGKPIYIDSKVVDFALKIGTTDISNQAVVNGNIITFTPTDKTIPNALQSISEKEITLDIWLKHDNKISASKTVKLNLIKPLYELEIVSGENTVVDIYDITNTPATLYFKLSIDGERLTKQEVQEGLANNTIKIDTHPFGWITLLPISADISIEEIDGKGVITCKTITTWPNVLANLFASFITTGDKAITVGYGDVTGEGIISLQDVSFISRLWRWIVIVISVYIIIHIILWILGFFVAKALPRGTMVRITLHQNFPAQFVNISTKLVNMKISGIVKWHLKRFIPFKEFTNQDSQAVYGMNIHINSDRNARMKLLTKMHEIVVLADDEDQTYLDFVAFKRKWRSYQPGSRRPSLEATTKKLNYLLEDRDKEYAVGRTVAVNETCYALKDERGRISSFIFFIKNKKK